MAIPRPVLIALLGLALCGAAFVATRSAGDSSSTVISTPAPVAPAPKQQAAPAAKQKAAPVHKPAQRAGAAMPHKATAKPQVATKTAPANPAKPALSADERKALTVLQASKRGDAVVLFFTGTGAADDTATRAAVASLHGMKHVTVVSAGLNELTTFRPILQGAGVSQVPAVVIARAGHGAQLIQGYVDSNTLRQNVADALR